jgi:hypothetical protein
MPPRRPANLPRWQELAVYASSAVLLLSGVAWLVFDKWIRIEGEFGPEYHPAEHWMLIAHAIGAYAFLVIVGALIPVHIPLGWRQKRNRASGVTVLTVCVILSVTALALYYVGEDMARSWASLVHWTVGLAAVPLLLIHVTRGRSRR